MVDAVRQSRRDTRLLGATSRVAVGAASAQSAALTAREVMLHASVRCFVKIAADPTAAATDSFPLEAGEKFTTKITSGHKVGVIRDFADGFLHITLIA